MFAVHHSNIWAFVKKIDDLIQDIYLDSMIISNDLVTTRQRPQNSTMTLQLTLKNQILNEEMTDINFLATHLGIIHVHDRISDLFLNNISLQSVQSTGSGNLIDETESQLPEYELSMPDFQNLDFPIEATESVIHNFDLLDDLSRLDLTRSAPSRQCIVCFGNKAGTFSHNCGHSSICFRCTAENIKYLIINSENSNYKYPHCRATISGFNRIL